MTMAPVTTTIPSRRYAVGEHIYGPWALTQGRYVQVDILPTADLPAGVTLDVFMEHSLDGGVTWQNDNNSPNVVGPQLAADLEEGSSLEVRWPNWQERMRLNVRGGPWTTGFTVTIRDDPMPA